MDDERDLHDLYGIEDEFEAQFADELEALAELGGKSGKRRICRGAEARGGLNGRVLGCMQKGPETVPGHVR